MESELLQIIYCNCRCTAVNSRHMKSRFIVRFLAVTLLLSPAAAFADLFDFSYIFANGSKIEGQLEGTANGQFVENVGSIWMSLNGRRWDGYVTQTYWPLPNSDALSPGSLVSFDPAQNNFRLEVSDNSTGDILAFFSRSEFETYGGGYRYIVDGSGYYVKDFTTGNFSDLSVTEGDHPNPARWALSRASESVPEGGVSTMLLGMLLFALSALRRRNG